MSKILIAIPTFENIMPETFKSIYDLNPCGNELSFEFVKGYDCARARNDIVKKALDGGFDYIFMVLSIIIIILCLLQGGKSEGASGAITGGGLNVFVKTKERGSERVVSIITYVLVIIFFIFATLILALGYVPAA